MRESLTFADEVAASRTYLLRFARLQLRNDVWAEDLVAEIQLAALEKQHNFGARSSLRTWLVAILKFNVIDCIRANRRESASSIDCSAGADFESLQFTPDGCHRDDVCDWASPEQMLSSKQFMEIVSECVNEMRHTKGRMFMMREWLGFSTDEICRELAISPSNAWVLLHRTRLRLRESLQTKWFDPLAPHKSNESPWPTWREITVRV